MFCSHIYVSFEKPNRLPWLGDPDHIYKNMKRGERVKKGAFAHEVRQAQELLESVVQMQNYATDDEMIEASIYLQKGCEILLNGYVKMNLQDSKTNKAAIQGGELIDRAKKLFEALKKAKDI